MPALRRLRRMHNGCGLWPRSWSIRRLNRDEAEVAADLRRSTLIKPGRGDAVSHPEAVPFCSALVSVNLRQLFCQRDVGPANMCFRVLEALPVASHSFWTPLV